MLRTLTGIAVGGALPLVFSLTGDLFPPTSRSYASSAVGLCMMSGAMAGQGVAGFMGPSLGQGLTPVHFPHQLKRFLWDEPGVVSIGFNGKTPAQNGSG